MRLRKGNLFPKACTTPELFAARKPLHSDSCIPPQATLPCSCRARGSRNPHEQCPHISFDASPRAELDYFRVLSVGAASPGCVVCVHLFKVVDMSLAQEVPLSRNSCSKYCPPHQPFQGLRNRCSDYYRSPTCTNRDWSH